MTQKQARLTALQNKITRLQRRQETLDRLSNRYSWIRVAIFGIGCALSIIAYFLFGWLICAAIAILTIAAFSFVATLHGRIERSINSYKLSQRIASMQIARLTLDWSAMPAPYPVTVPANHPFATDLDITGERSLHQLLNTAASQEGSQRLASWLLTTHPDLDTIRRRQALVQELTPMTRFRNKLMLKSLVTNSNSQNHLEGQRLLTWLDANTAYHSFLPTFIVSIALSTLTILLFILNLLALIPPEPWVVSLVLAIGWFYTKRSERGELFEDAFFLRDAFSQVSSIFAYLETYPYGQHKRLKKLCEPFFVEPQNRPSALLKGLARLDNAATLEKNQLLWLIVNALIPWDTYIAWRLQHYKVLLIARLPTWLDTWFELEAFCSLANFAYLNPGYTLPDVQLPKNAQNDILFFAQALGHPLISAEARVVNDFTLDERGEIVIITGSNMSGKSTFLRTLGINLALTFAGGPVNAHTFQTTLYRIFTCIRVSDSVTDGYSYFYAEVKRLKALLVELDRDDPMPLFALIDEIFKGTNNRERLLGSQSYIESLAARNCTGAISTHDLELVNLADILPKIRNYHFREDVINGHMVFDYILRPGPCPTTNALKIMQLEGLPVKLDTIKEQ